MKNIHLLLIPVLAISVPSCKKSESEKPACNLVTISPHMGSVTNLYYDGQNRLQTIRTGTTTIKLEYKGDSLISTESSLASVIQKNRCKLNAQGLPVAVRQEVDLATNLWFRHEYEYNSTELNQKTTITPSNFRSTTSYTWSDGNLTRSLEGSITWEYEYYTDKPNQSGDAFTVEMLEADGGIAYIRNKNLLKKRKYTNPAIGISYYNMYEYQFDNDGKVSKVIRATDTSPLRVEWELQYVCK